MKSDTTKIKNNNIIIAEFMEFVQIKDDKNRLWLDNKTSGMTMINPDDDKFNEFLHPKYHSSWDWLMPVVKKLKEEQSKRWLNVGTLQGYINSCWTAMRDNDIQECFKNAAEGIEWYNEHI